jgi:putative pyruvate formate lyase activating enzyme
MKYEEYIECNLCHRECSVNRYEKNGFCNTGAKMLVARAAPHMWEEPCISGTRGSGTIFFSGCSLSCVFCQNREISRGRVGREVGSHELANIMLRLQSEGVHNINFVTPTHFVPEIRDTVAIARDMGLKIPIVYNTGNYERLETLKSLSGTVDIYLPDAKYYLERSAGRYSSAPDYPKYFIENIAEMLRQVGAPTFNSEGIMTRGVIVRLLLLPSHTAEAKLILSSLYKSFGDEIYLSLMNQYTPMPNMEKPLDRRVSCAEYDELLEYAIKLGVKNAYFQSGGTADESFIPPFNLDGVR